jgi:hypothetical protein
VKRRPTISKKNQEHAEKGQPKKNPRREKRFNPEKNSGDFEQAIAGGSRRRSIRATNAAESHDETGATFCRSAREPRGVRIAPTLFRDEFRDKLNEPL